MCAYNEINGVPACAEPRLTAALRKAGGDDFFIVSDYDAWQDLGTSRHLHRRREAYAPGAAAAAPTSGAGTALASCSSGVLIVSPFLASFCARVCVLVDTQSSARHDATTHWCTITTITS